MSRYLAAILLGSTLALGFGLASKEARHQAELQELTRERDLAEYRLWACERAITTDYTAAQDRAAERCELAATSCATAAKAGVQLERRVRSFLWVGPGPRVQR